MIDSREYEQLARETGAFKDIELEILKETLQSWKSKPGDPYTILELRDGRTLAGFAVLSRAANTEFTFDVTNICVERVYKGKGVGRSLVTMLEEEALRKVDSALVRFELSRLKEDAVGRGLFSELGYTLIGHIEDFYEEGNDYFIYAKHLSRVKQDEGDGSEGKEPVSVKTEADGENQDRAES
jgi:ribosomal protein S18 acetylase RimI-like enzyme